MGLLFAERLKKCRRERDLTQEQLAEKIGISPQSVSKWERGDGYPDITHLPVIANFFGITIDTLLGNDEAAKEEDIEQFYDKLNEMDTSEEKVAYNLEYARKYPDKDHITLNLCWSIMLLPEKKREKYLPLLKESCEKIIRESTNQGFRENAVEFMCRVCDDAEFEKWYALCEDSYEAYKGEVLEKRLWEQKKYEESRLRFDVNNLRILLHFMFRDNRNWAAPERAVEWYAFRLRLIEFLAEDGKIPDAWLGAYAQHYFRIACASFGCGRREEGYAYLEKAFELYPAWFAIPDGTHLDVGSRWIFGGVKIAKDHWRIRLPDGSDEWSGDLFYFDNQRDFMYTCMTRRHGWEWFDSVREEPRFLEYVERARKFTEEDGEN
ncbi:MAG: helix-turn-helix transcriptional regulator [Clostridia bacterium]|nr:helix-turn-helix transcriptional regulator [Clostridia bacterium]